MKREMTTKRAQVTLFIIIAIVIVGVVVSGVYFITSSGRNNEVSPTTTLVQASTTLGQARDKCINDLSIAALDNYGLNQTLVQANLTGSFESCINPLIVKYQKVFDIKSLLNSVNVSVNNKEIIIFVDYTLNITKSGQSQELKSGPLVIQRLISKTLNHDANCIVSEETSKNKKKITQQLRPDRLAKKELRVAEYKQRLRRLRSADKQQAKVQRAISRALRSRKENNQMTPSEVQNMYRQSNSVQNDGNMLHTPNLFTSQDNRERSARTSGNILSTPNSLLQAREKDRKIKWF